MRWLKGSSTKGLHQVTWDLRWDAPNAVELSKPDFKPPWVTDPRGPLAAPGDYTVQLYTIDDGEIAALSEAQSFVVKPVHGADFDYAQVAAFQKKTAELRRQVAHAGEELTRTEELLTHMKAAVLLAPGADAELIVRLDGLGAALTNLKTQLAGDAVRAGLDEATSPSIAGRAYNSGKQLE